ncbi:MAG: hypothetical protein ACJA04_001036 [Cellvibrionaceae bacterium]|jgi:hypothetical protein
MRGYIGLVSWFLIALIVGIEVSSLAFVTTSNTENLKSPGLGIMSLAFIDGILLYSWTTIKAGSIIPEKILTPGTKVANFLFFLFLLSLSITTIFTAIALIMLMISLLLAIPFGTIVYMIAYADFPKGAAQTTLAILMSLKILFAVSLVVGEKRLFEDYRKFLLLLLCSFVANIIIGFVHGIVPGFLVSITDAVGAIIVIIIALFWIITMFFGSTINMITLIMDALGMAAKIRNIRG